MNKPHEGPTVARRSPCRSDTTMQTNTRLLLLSLVGWCASEPLPTAVVQRRDASQAYARNFAREYEPYVFAAIPLHAPVPVLHVLSPAPLAVPPAAYPLNTARPTQAHTATKRERPFSSSVRTTPFTRPYPDSQTYAESRPHLESRPYVESRPYPETGPFAEPRPYPAEPRPYTEIRHYPDRRPYSNSVEYEESSMEYVKPVYRQRPRVRTPATTDYSADYDAYSLVLPSAIPQLSYVKPAASYEVDSSAYSSQEVAPTILYARPSISGGYTYRTVTNKKHGPKKPSAQKAVSTKEGPYLLKIHKHKIVKS